MSYQGIAVSQLVQFVGCLSMEEVAGWREHAEFIKAWNNGLSWFVNFTDGDRLDRVFSSYVDYLRRSDFGNLPRPDGYEDDDPNDDTFEKEGGDAQA